MQVAHLAEERLILDLVLLQDVLQSGLEFSVVLQLIGLVLLDLVQQFLDGGSCVKEYLLS